MGNCGSSMSTSFESIIYTDLFYNTQVTIKIKQRSGNGRVIDVDTVKFQTTQPEVNFCRNITFGRQMIKLSACVLPGLDPRQQIDKECQDGLFFNEIDGGCIAVLFDGHGAEGRDVVDFAIKFMNDYFTNNANNFYENPLDEIENIITECDRHLKQNDRDIDCSLSGSTAVVVYLCDKGLYVGSVGDSRAIIGSNPHGDQTVPKPPEYKKKKFYRTILPKKALMCEQLTVDQKPNHEEELNRIERAGGKVQRLTDNMGNRIGPYRVWRKSGNLPGLAMSRSIGDSVAFEIGVISTPIKHEFPIVTEVDQFIIMASDGVWDVMENIEVVNFVERFRNDCSGKSAPGSRTIKPNSTTIAHLLCEEARYRWFSILEEEDVMIDDISVIVIELASGGLFGSSIHEYVNRKTVRLNSIHLQEPKANVSPMPAPRSSDPIRGSFVPADKAKRATRRDPTRGSTAIANESVTDETLDIPTI